jgi:ComF family protein
MSLLSIANSAYDGALALIYPQPCAICGASVESRHDGVACAACWEATHLFSDDDTLCWKCGTHSQAAVAESNREGVRCGRCDDDSFTAARAAGMYVGALRASILELKRQPDLPYRLVQVLSNALQRRPLDGVDLIMPVPLHAARERERGFNQALVLARAVARAEGLQLDQHSLIRKTHTQMHRGGMDAKARRKSVAGAFEVRHQDLIAGRRVLLIDDVFTTGATVSACAAKLVEAGASEVLVLTVARA